MRKTMVVFLLILFMAAAFGLYEENLVSQYKFDETTGNAVYDSHGNIDANSLNDLSGMTVPGLFGQNAFQFNGIDDCIFTDQNFYQTFNKPHSINVWAKYPAMDWGDTWSLWGIIDQDTLQDYFNVFRVMENLPDNYLEINYTLNDPTGFGSFIYTHMVIPASAANEWHMFTMAIDDSGNSGEYNVYVDGIKVSAAQPNIPLNLWCDNFDVPPINQRTPGFGWGCEMQGYNIWSLFSKATLQDGRIYNRFLTESEVKLLYRSYDNNSPDFNIWTINGYDFNKALPFFKTDQNITIGFSVKDLDNDRLKIKDLNLSLTGTQGTGTRYVSDLNLSGLVCQPQNWETGISICSWQINATGAGDNNYYAIGRLTDDLNTVFKNPGFSFGFDGTGPVVGALSFTGFTISGAFINGTGTISATVSDARSGLASCEYSLSGLTWYPATLSSGVCTSPAIEAVNGIDYSFQIRGTDNVGNIGTGPAVSYTGNKVILDPENVTEENLKNVSMYGLYTVFSALGPAFLGIFLLIFALGIMTMALFYGKR